MRLAASLLALLLLAPLTRPDDRVTEQRIQKGLASITARGELSKVAKLASDALEGRNAGYRGCRQAGDWIGQQFEALGLKPIGEGGTYFQTFTFSARGGVPQPDDDGGGLAGGDKKKNKKKKRKARKKRKKPRRPVPEPLYDPPTSRNVVALLEGSDPQRKDEVIIVGGHYDHVGREGQWNRASRRGRPKGKDDIWNGADDNASGTAAVMAVAEAFAASGIRPPRSVLFICFSAEEHGLCGSRWYCDHPLLPLEKTVAMLNLDMVGHKKKGAMEVAGVDHASGHVLRKAVTRATKRVKGLQYRLAPWAISGSSDHAPFIKRSVPAVFFFNGLHKDYHTVEDEVDGVSGRRMANVAKVVFLTVLELAALPEKPTFVKGQAGTSPAGILGVTVAGTLSGQEAKKLRLKRKQGGVRVENVYPGSVAGEAGVIPGDIIVRLGTHDVKLGREMLTLRNALNKVKPGRRFTIRVVRGRKKLSLKAKMGR